MLTRGQMLDELLQVQLDSMHEWNDCSNQIVAGMTGIEAYRALAPELRLAPLTDAFNMLVGVMVDLTNKGGATESDLKTALDNMYPQYGWPTTVVIFLARAVSNQGFQKWMPK